MTRSLHVCVELSGGAELLFGGKKHLRLTLEEDSPWPLSRLLTHLREDHLKERPELFLAGDSVRPGILVLVNEADWELCGQLDYQLKDRDIITFISTLHGG